MCFYTCIISQSELILQPLTGFKVHFILLLFCVFVLFCVGVGACMWACLGMKVDFHYKSSNVREGLWTCCSVHAWVCGPVPMLVTKGRSLFLFFFFALQHLECFCMRLACALEHYCHPTVAQRVCLQQERLVPLLVYICVWAEECPSCGLFTKQLFSYFSWWHANTVVAGNSAGSWDIFRF